MGEEGHYGTQRFAPPVTARDLVAAGFEDVTEIGSGGFGVVFRCRQPILDRIVAVKVLAPETQLGALHESFHEERALGRMTGHPNIVNLLEIGKTPSGRSFIVMPYYATGSLGSRIRAHGALSIEEVLRLGVRLSGAIETTHHLKVVHGDVKPSNILVSDYGEPILSDFGIARIGGDDGLDEGFIAGSVAFSAPEVIAGSRPTPASDVYGLGASMLCALTGYEIFDARPGETPSQQAERIASSSVAVLTMAGMTEDVCSAVGSAMARDSGDRPSAALFGEQLQQIQAVKGFQVDQMAVLDQRANGGGAILARYRPQSIGLARRMWVAEGNLPLVLTTFVNRRAEMTAAKNALAVSRLVTVVGVGGVGKTRLALRIAEKTHGDFPDGAWLVELAELRDGSLVAEAISGALQLRSQSARSPLEVLAEFLSTRRLLLVLDNCEQIVETVADIIEKLLRRCPGLRVLVTSREPLNIDGETLLHVPPMPIPEEIDNLSPSELPKYDAITLFVERAAAAVPGFVITEANCTAVARICAVLDGLPLAIELAAARLASMSPDQIVDRLANSATILTHGRRGAPARHRTLGAVIGWSYELCTATEQATWARLSVFAGSFELDAAEEVLAEDLPPTETLDILSSLLDKSILTREEVDGMVRFRMLNTIRDYGRDRLNRSGEAPHWRRRHRDWYQRFVVAANVEWISERQREFIDRLVRELPNLREALGYTMSGPPKSTTTALHFVNALDHFWLARGVPSEARYWIDRARSSTTKSEGNDIELAETLSHGVVFAGAQGDIAEARSLVAESRSLGSASKSSMVRAHVCHAEGFLALITGEFLQAESYLREERELFESNDDLGRQVEILLLLAWAHTLSGNCMEALSYFDQAESISETHGEETYRSYSFWGAGVAMWKLGRMNDAERALQQGTALASAREDPFVASLSIETLAWLAAANGDAIRAATLLAAAAEVARTAGCTPVIFPALWSYHEECIDAVSMTLTAAELESARRRAHSFTLAEATAFALGESLADNHSDGRQSAGLTKRESEVAALVAQGMTNKAIAAKLFISQRTVHGHVEHILSKLAFTSRTQIAAWVARG